MYVNLAEYVLNPSSVLQDYEFIYYDRERKKQIKLNKLVADFGYLKNWVKTNLSVPGMFCIFNIVLFFSQFNNVIMKILLKTFKSL